MFVAVQSDDEAGDACQGEAESNLFRSNVERHKKLVRISEEETFTTLSRARVHHGPERCALDFAPVFKDRVEAGEKLAGHIAKRVHGADLLVLGLPRGGVPVAFEVARALRAELDVYLVRKLGLPGHEELAVGAVADGGVRVLNDALLRELRLSPQLIARIAGREERELERRHALYRKDRPALRIGGRTVVLVDDGLATGASMKAAAQALRVQDPRRIIAAVPVGAAETCSELLADVDEMVCLFTPRPFFSVSAWYEQFSQTTDEEVQRLLDEAARQNK